MQIILLGLLVVAAFAVGILWSEVKNLKKTATTTTPKTATPNADTPVKNLAQQAPPAKTADNVPPVTGEDHVKGNKSARIALIEYSDLECPFCKRFHPTAQQIVDAYNGQVMWVYRHFPLENLHPNAQMEAEAAECAAAQQGNDGFWQFVDTIFKRTAASGSSFTKDQLADLVAELGFNKNKFNRCLNSGKYRQKVRDEMNAGAAAGISGTPGNILLDTKSGSTQLIPGAVPYEQIKQAIDAMLKT